ncbi:MAG: CHAT domain-containing protein [Flammeovirgaceae bacterium]
MKKFILLASLLLGISLTSQAQLNGWKNKLKNKINKEKAKLTNKDKLKNSTETELQKQQSKLDTISFSYAISMTDNSAYVARNKSNAKALGLDALRDQNGKLTLKRSRSEKAMSMNRQGEALYQIRNYRLAGLKFLTALMVYTDESDAEAMFENPWELLKNKDTRNKVFESMLRTEANTTGFTHEDYFAYTKTLDNFSLLLHARGRYTIAKSLAERALQLREEYLGEAHPATGASYNNLSVLYKDMGMYSEAEELIDPALSIQANKYTKESMPYAITLNNKALLFQMIGRYDIAKRHMEEALEIVEDQSNKKSKVMPFQVNLALLHQDLKEYEEAETIFTDLLELRSNRPRPLQTEADAYLLNHLAALYMEMGKTAETEKYLKQSLAIYKQKLGEKHPSYASVLSNLSKYYQYKSMLPEAMEANQQVIEIRKNVLGENHPDFIAAWETQGILLWKANQVDEAIPVFKRTTEKQLELAEKLFPSMNEHEKGKYWDKIQPKLMRFYNFAMDNHKNHPELAKMMYQIHLKTKGILLNASTKVKNQILNGANEELKQHYLEWLDQKEALAVYYTLSNEELKDEGIDLDSLEQATLQTEKQLIKSSAAFANAYQFPQQTFQDVHQSLAEKEAAIELVRVPKFDQQLKNDTHYAALIVKKSTNTPTLVVLENGQELESKYSKFYRTVITNQIEDTYSYDQFWAAIEQELTDINSVFLSLDGIYNQINIATLKKPDGQFVIDGLNITTVSSTRQIPTLKANHSKHSKSDAILFGFPHYGDKGSIAKLPGTKAEVEAIGKILANYDYKSTHFMEKEASESNIKTEVNNPKILHIATHGFFLEDVENLGSDKIFGVEINKAKENPLLRSGLMFHNAESALENTNSKELKENDNGILTAYEAMNLPLDQTELVILSACETGLGEIKSGEGVYGLQRAFQVAGAESIIISLWKVSDDATHKLMVKFYENWLRSGNKVTAFNQAQLDLKNEYTDPYYWGAFILMN